MSILLTGGCGYIGSHTAVELLQAGYDVVVTDNLSNSSPVVMQRVAQICGRAPHFYQIDLTDAAALNRVFSQHNIEAVLHFADFKTLGGSVAFPLLYYRNNIDVTLTLLEAMSRYSCKRIIFSSAAAVYGSPHRGPITERSQPGHCTTPYGWSKMICEQILRDLAVADKAMSVVLLRYFNPIGAHESGLLGEAPKGVPNNVMPYITKVAAGQLPQLNIYGGDYPTPDGTAIRDYTHIMDLAAGLAAALGYAGQHRGVATFNLGTGRGTSVLELVSTFASVNQVQVPYVIAPRRPGDAPVTYADPTLAGRSLGWQPKRRVRDMCRDSWRWQQMNPNGYDS